MSILIRGMEMPTSCYQCGFLFRPERHGKVYCTAVEPMMDISETLSDERASGCPLVPVPPHGRLIDADALTEIISKVIGINASIDQRNEATDQERRCLWWFEEQVNIAPTIIPAEEGE